MAIKRHSIPSDYPRMPRLGNGETWHYIPVPAKPGRPRHFVVTLTGASLCVIATSAGDAARQVQASGLCTPDTLPVAREASMVDIEELRRRGMPIPPLPEE